MSWPIFNDPLQRISVLSRARTTPGWDVYQSEWFSSTGICRQKVSLTGCFWDVYVHTRGGPSDTEFNTGGRLQKQSTIPDKDLGPKWLHMSHMVTIAWVACSAEPQRHWLNLSRRQFKCWRFYNSMQLNLMLAEEALLTCLMSLLSSEYTLRDIALWMKCFGLLSNFLGRNIICNTDAILPCC